MNCLFLKAIDHLEAQVYRVTSQEKLSHLSEHLKLKVGDELKISVENLGYGKGIVQELNAHNALIQIGELQKPKQKEIHLFVGISRPPTMKKILEHGTSMGVTHFHLIGAELSEKSYFDSKIYEKEALQELLILGLEQATCFCQIPTITKHISLQAVKPFGRSYILHPDADVHFFNLKFNENEVISIAIGPERGWTTHEVNQLNESGFIPAQLGPSRLRTEIATFASLAHLL